MPVTADEMQNAGVKINGILHAAGMTTGEAVFCLAGIIAHALADETDDRTQATIAELNYLILKGRERFHTSRDEPKHERP